MLGATAEKPGDDRRDRRWRAAVPAAIDDPIDRAIDRAIDYLSVLPVLTAEFCLSRPVGGVLSVEPPQVGSSWSSLPELSEAWLELSHSPEAIAVAVFNLLLSLLGFAAALGLTYARRRLSAFADRLAELERLSRLLLPEIPPQLDRSQQQVRDARDRLQRLRQRWQLSQQAVGLAIAVVRFYRRRSPSRQHQSQAQQHPADEMQVHR